MSAHRRNANLNAVALSGIALAMLGVSFWSPTLYRLFCQGTGYEGTPKTENVAHSTQTTTAEVTVRFDANVNSALAWRFQPVQREVRLRLGEETLIQYTATNLSNQPLTGTATFNVVPDKAGVYFSKLECFCFTEQTLAPGQEITMPVVFYVDPGLAEDPTTRDVSTITLSYTFYRTDNEPKQPGSTAAIADTRAVRAGG
jgi:cytochrome c oxidase assembly protein subunit 11